MGSQRMPAVFIGRGQPMNAALDNPFTRAVRRPRLKFKLS